MLSEYLTNKDMKFSDEAIHLLFAANRWEIKEQIMKDLEEGINIICDRYAYSGVVYSAAKVPPKFEKFKLLFRVWTSIGASNLIKV